MKYKIGDKVKIVSIDEFKSCQCRNHKGDMDIYCGKEAVIIDCIDNLYTYKINIDGGKWYWYDSMFVETGKHQEEIQKSLDLMMRSIFDPFWPSTPFGSSYSGIMKLSAQHPIQLIGKHKFLKLKVKA